MSASTAFRRLELAFGVLGLTAASLVLVIAMDAARFHLATFWTGARHLNFGAMQPEGWVLVALAALDAVVIVRGMTSTLRHLRAHRAFLRALPVRGEIVIAGTTVRVVPGRTLNAFCAGLLRPCVYLSDGVLSDVTTDELRAILAHEAHHRARRDPLRLLLAKVVSEAFGPFPPLARLADRHVALADLAADYAAVEALGAVQPLAAALARFDDEAAVTGRDVAPERVDQLIRRTPPEAVPSWLLVIAGFALAGILAPALPMLVLGWHPSLAVPVAVEAAALVAACGPAYVAARRADNNLRPASACPACYAA